MLVDRPLLQTEIQHVVKRGSVWENNIDKPVRIITSGDTQEDPGHTTVASDRSSRQLRSFAQRIFL